MLSHAWLFETLWTVDHQVPLPLGFFRQEYWSRLPFPTPGDLPDPGIKPVSPVSPALQMDSLPAEPLGIIQMKLWKELKKTKNITYAVSTVHNKLWKILKEMGIPHHLTCRLRNLYAGQEATVRTGHGTTDWFQIGKGVHQGCILSPCFLNLYAEYIIRNARLEEAQAGIKTAGRNINNLRHADDTTLMAESEEELKAFWSKWKRRVKKLA